MAQETFMQVTSIVSNENNRQRRNLYFGYVRVCKTFSQSLCLYPIGIKNVLG